MIGSVKYVFKELAELTSAAESIESPNSTPSPSPSVICCDFPGVWRRKLDRALRLCTPVKREGRKRTLKQRQRYRVQQNQGLYWQQSPPKMSLCERANAHYTDEQSKSQLGTMQPPKRACSFSSGLSGEEVKTLDTRRGLTDFHVQIPRSSQTVSRYRTEEALLPLHEEDQHVQTTCAGLAGQKRPPTLDEHELLHFAIVEQPIISCLVAVDTRIQQRYLYISCKLADLLSSATI